MKIALIGTSPIMTLLALKIYKKHEVTIFEKRKKFGGAWSFDKFRNYYICNKTNVIGPTSKFQEKYVISIINYLKKKYKVKIKKNYETYETIAKYKPKNIYKFKLEVIYNFLKKSGITIKKKYVKKFVINNKQVIIDGEKFDKIILPTYVGINSAKINGIKINFEFKKITSKHIFFITTQKFIKSFYYDENFNNFVDRAQYKKINKYHFFTARIRKKFKNTKLKKLFNLLGFNIKKKNLVDLKLVKYENYFRNDELIKDLLKLDKYREIQIVDTRQFVPAFKKLRLAKN